MMGWVVDLLRRLQRSEPAPPPVIDRKALREEMTRTDPEFARVRQAQHDALQALTAKGIQDGIALRREREFWEQYPS